MAIETIIVPNSFYDPKTQTQIFEEIEITGETFTASIGKADRKFIIHKCKFNGWVLTDVKTGAGMGRQCKHKKMTINHATALINARTAIFGLEDLTEMFKNAETTGALTKYH
jgi:hypothetical protein